MTDSRPSPRSPWRTLAVGVVLAVCTIAAIGAYTYTEVRRLRDEQTAISERNRKDSLQLLRIQNDLASLGRADARHGRPHRTVSAARLAAGVRAGARGTWRKRPRLEQSLAPAVREPAQQARLTHSIDAYWCDVAKMFALSRTDEAAAGRIVATSLIPQHRAIDGLVSQFLIVNNQVQEEAARANRAVYDRVGREILLLVGVTADRDRRLGALGGGRRIAARSWRSPT